MTAFRHLCLACLCLLSGELKAEDNTWIGTTGTWDNAANWSVGSVPDSATLQLDFPTVGFKTITLGGGTYAADTLVFSSSSGTYALYTGTLALAGGVTRTGNGSVGLASSLSLVGTGPTLTFHSGTSTGSLSVGGPVSGAANIFVEGSSLTSFSAANSYTGTTTIREGAILTVSNTGGLGSATAGTVVENGATLNLQANGSYFEPLTISGTGRNGVGALFAVDGAVLNGGVVMAGDSRISGGNIAEANGGLSGNASLEKTGSGILTLLGAHTYTGDTVINGGTVLIDALEGLGTSTNAVQVNSSGTLRYGSTGTLGGARVVQVNGGTVDSGSGTWEAPILLSGTSQLTGLGTYAGVITSADSRLVVSGSGVTTFTGPINLGSGGLTINKYVSGYHSGAYYNPPSTGRAVLNTASLSYTGATELAGGTMEISSVASLPSGNLIFKGPDVLGTAVLETNGSFSRSLGTGNNQVQWLGSGGFGAIGGDLAVDLGSSVTWNSGGFVPTGSSLVLSSTTSTDTVTFASKLNLGSATRRIYVGNGAADIDAVFSDIISGSGALEKFGPGTLLLPENNTFSGGLIIRGGVVEVPRLGGNTGSNGPAGQGKVILNSGTLRYTAYSTGGTNRFGSNSLEWSGAIEMTDPSTDFHLNSTFTGLYNYYSTGTFSGYYEHSDLTKLGPGAITFTGSGANAHINLLVAEGIVKLQKSGSAYSVENLTVEVGALAGITGTSGNQINEGLTVHGAFNLNGTNEQVSFLNGNSGGGNPKQ